MKLKSIQLPKRMEHLVSILKFKNEYDFHWEPVAHHDVDNCLDASVARKIELHQEMKSILFKLRSGLFLCHLRGNEIINDSSYA
ncbi:MAG: hypothetical protein GY810_15470 [Aureispira sp.]|nr:hypothetical protein [Aureispira sp.]